MGRHYVESGVTVENLDVEVAIKMVKAGVTDEEIKIAKLDEIMPKRKYTRGMAPTLNMREVIKRMNQKAKMIEEGEVVETKWTAINKI